MKATDAVTGLIGASLLILSFMLINSLLNSPQFLRNQLFHPGSVGHEKEVPSAEKGLDFLTNTYQRLPQFVGAKINCTNCHLNGGKQPLAGPWVGVKFRFPQYRNRTGREVSLVDRINDCFERSLNGKPLPKKHPAMLSMLAYMESLSPDDKVKGRGIPKLKLSIAPDRDNGKKVYEVKCAYCHQKGGEGLFTPDGQVIYPPLWGEDSFNIAAGMARLHTAAGFVKQNMPLGQGGSLTDKEAWDVAAYFSTQPRPDFAKKHLDWPKGKKPEDARY
ncbi:MAG: c-type cytochrome [Bdellovibrionales bacterium]|nr:c-type cytochrome [Bdellovibrionales bacterium]